MLSTQHFLEPRLIFAVIPLLLNLCPGNVSPYELLEGKDKEKKKALHFFNKNFKKLSHFTGKAKRFTEPEGEAKHKPDHGHGLQ